MKWKKMGEKFKSKSILLHGWRNPPANRNQFPRDSNLEPTDAWFIIKYGGGSVEEPVEIFMDLTASTAHDSNIILVTNLAQVGSFLYALGGRGPSPPLPNDNFSNCVRRLDLENPKDGWKVCGALPYPCPLARVGVAGNLIFLFPHFFNGQTVTGGCVYDVSEHKGYPMEIPPGKESDSVWRFPFCAGFNDGSNCMVLAPIYDNRHFCAYIPSEKKWVQCSSLQLNPPATNIPPVSAVLNGILYVSYEMFGSSDPPNTLFAYDIASGQPLLGDNGIAVRKFKKRNRRMGVEMELVALADFKLCYIWYALPTISQEDCITVFIATVVVNPAKMSAHVLEQEFTLRAHHLLLPNSVAI